MQDFIRCKDFVTTGGGKNRETASMVNMTGRLIT